MMDGLRTRGWRVDAPAAGKGIGKQLRFYRKNQQRDA
jgi:hypothetical protein